MDLTSVREVIDARRSVPWHQGDAWLAGGTSLFAEVRPHLTRLRDLTTLGWPALTVTEAGLEIAATCTVAELLALAEDAGAPWPHGRALIAQCCRAFSSSFKVWNTATVGGNLCLALPAGPMVSMTVALRGTCRVRDLDGHERHIRAAELVTGAGTTQLSPGELLCSLTLPAAALSEPSALRRVTLQPQGRSAALVTGMHEPHARRLTITVTAATTRPLTVSLPRAATTATLRRTLDHQLSPELMVDDVHGRAAWRREMALLLAEEVRQLLVEGR
jgi:CO/xanthine dehydrogenase FAD-binding subunit